MLHCTKLAEKINDVNKSSLDKKIVVVFEGDKRPPFFMARSGVN